MFPEKILIFYNNKDENISRCPCNLSDFIPIPTAVARRFVSLNWSDDGKHIGMIVSFENLLFTVAVIPKNDGLREGVKVKKKKKVR